MFPRLIGQSGYNKRLRKAFFLFIRVIRMLAMDTSLWSDDVWVVDSTPVQCGCSRETVKRSDAGGMGGVRVLRQSLPVLLGTAAAPGLHPGTGCRSCSPWPARRPTSARSLLGMLEAGRDVVAAIPGRSLIGDKNYFGRAFEAELTERELTLLRPVRKGEARRAGQQLLKPLRQVIESVNWTLKGQLDLERHGGRTPEGIIARVLAQRILALTAAIWHNDKTGQPVMRSLTAYDH